MLSSVAWPVLHYFLTLFLKGHDFMENVIEHNVFFYFLHTYSLKYFSF